MLFQALPSLYTFPPSIFDASENTSGGIGGPGIQHIGFGHFFEEFERLSPLFLHCTTLGTGRAATEPGGCEATNKSGKDLRGDRKSGECQDKIILQNLKKNPRHERFVSLLLGF